MEFYEGKYAEAIREFKEALGYYDLMIITEVGDVCYSVIKQSDLAQNILTGDLKESPISGFFQNRFANDYRYRRCGKSAR